MNVQFGGLKLKDTNKTGFTPIIDMINKPSSQMKVLTYSSLKGFMITLDVSEDDTEYFGLKNGRFEKPVTSYLLKFAVISPNNDEKIPSYKNVKKATESQESFYEEAKLQQNIWTKSISGGRPELCPPVANFSLFDNNNSKNLCVFFKNKSVDKVKDIFDYFDDLLQLHNDYGLGVLIMPNIQGSLKFGDFLRAPVDKVDKAAKNEAYASVSAKVVRLFVEIGVIHFDLHDGNALIYFKPDGIDSVIIDFGRASNILTSNNDDYLSPDEKVDARKEKEKFYNQLLSMDPNSPDVDKKQYILDVLNYVADLDFEKNQQMFQFSDPDRYQMDWFEKMPSERVPVETFNILMGSIKTIGLKMSVSTIKTYMSKGYILDFNRRPLDSFIAEFPETSVPYATPSISKMFKFSPSNVVPSQNSLGHVYSSQDCDELTGMCTVSGGRKRRTLIKRMRNKNKHHNKSWKKIKKFNKNNKSRKF